MIEIDGSEGEGGGQIFRSSITLSMWTGRPVRITNIRAGRKKPGLLRQHLTAVKLAARICAARVEGAALGSTTLLFEPSEVRAGTYDAAIGSAGSASLVLQTVLPALIGAAGESEVVVQGGTHNPSAPTFDMLSRSYLPQLAQMGTPIQLTLERHGFFPRGGGRLRARCQPGALRRLELERPGAIRGREAVATVADLPAHVAQREIGTLTAQLGIPKEHAEVEVLPEGRGPGNVCRVELKYDHVTLVFTEQGKRGVSAEKVAQRLARQVRRFERAGVAVDEHLADQLLLPMAMGEGGRFTTLRPTPHTRIHAVIIQRFLDKTISLTELGEDRWLVDVG